MVNVLGLGPGLGFHDGQEGVNLVVRNSFEMWISEKWEEWYAWFDEHSIVTKSSPPGHFNAKAKIDAEKSAEHIQAYDEWLRFNKGYNALREHGAIKWA